MSPENREKARQLRGDTAEGAKKNADEAEASGDVPFWVYSMRDYWNRMGFDDDFGPEPTEKIEVGQEFHLALAAAVREKAYAVYPDVADIDGAIKFRNRPVVARA